MSKSYLGRNGKGMMLQSRVCKSFNLWTEVVNTACYIRNSCPLNHIGNRTLYESKKEANHTWNL